MSAEKAGALALNSVFGYEPGIPRALISGLGSAAAVFSLSSEERNSLFGPYVKHRDAVTGALLEEAERELERLYDSGLQFVGITEPEYPALLKECEDAPVGLYIRSTTPVGNLFKEESISVVGTRDISPYGKEWCRRIVAALGAAEHKPCIVSGLAIGVDITAHLAALEGGMSTIAVLPTGIDDIYPSRHREAAARIAQTPGCALITDYPPHTAVQAVNFLRRNRIIAGLSRATVLVESKIKGGGMMTARLSSGYGREVYALPGRVDDLRSQGCNLLIKEKLAEPLDRCGSLAAEMGLGPYRRSCRQDFLKEVRTRLCSGSGAPVPTDHILKVAALIKEKRGICLDEISVCLDMPYAEVSSAAGILESEGLICTDVLQRCSVNFKIA